ncbi:MAG: ribulose-phosphate 3-epimerase [bacterium]|nr:MAG: ribulose-phosphate 3-epimerase [bacterium]
MPSDFKILPSILAADAGKIIEEARTVDIPEIEYLHIDVMDGHFVPNLTMGPQIVSSLKKHTRFKLDVHLMITNASEMIPVFVDAGADIITIHQEAVKHLDREINQIKDLGIKAGVSLNPATHSDSLRWIISDVDLILVMSVNPGFGGQKYIPAMSDKLAMVARMKQEYEANFILEVDGGIDIQTAFTAYRNGARYFVAGSAIFSHQNRIQAIHDIINSIEKQKSDGKTTFRV